MRKLELIFGILILASMVMRFMLIPSFGLLTVFSLTLLAILYFPFGFAFFNGIQFKKIFSKQSYKISIYRIMGAIGFGMGLSAICFGILYKLQGWPGADKNLIVGLTVVFIVLVIALFKFFNRKDKYYKSIFKRIIIIGDSDYYYSSCLI